MSERKTFKEFKKELAEKPNTTIIYTETPVMKRFARLISNLNIADKMLRYRVGRYDMEENQKIMEYLSGIYEAGVQLENFVKDIYAFLNVPYKKSLFGKNQDQKAEAKSETEETGS